MNSWHILWQSYFKSASNKRVIQQIIWRGNIWYKIYSFSIYILFIYFAFSYFQERTNTYFFLTIFFEAVVLYYFYKNKNAIMMNEFGDAKKVDIPSDNSRLDTRYQIFKRELKAHYISHEHVEECFELIDIQCDLNANTVAKYRLIIGFFSAVILGMLAKIWQSLGVENLKFYIMIVCLIAFIAFFVRALIPSKAQQLLELKYFMKLYNRDWS